MTSSASLPPLLMESLLFDLWRTRVLHCGRRCGMMKNIGLIGAEEVV